MAAVAVHAATSHSRGSLMPDKASRRSNNGRERDLRDMREAAAAGGNSNDVRPKPGEWWILADGRPHVIMNVSAYMARPACPANPQLYKQRAPTVRQFTTEHGRVPVPDQGCTDCLDIINVDPRAPGAAILQAWIDNGRGVLRQYTPSEIRRAAAAMRTA